MAMANGTTLYSAANWRQPVALIIGNEARGVGEEAKVLLKYLDDMKWGSYKK